MEQNYEDNLEEIILGIEEKPKRNDKKIVILIFVLVGIISVLLILSALRSTGQLGPSLPGPVTEHIKLKKVKVDEAKDALLNGEIDMFVGSIDHDDAQELEDNKNFTLYPAVSTMVGFYVNPYPDSKEELNPFSIQKVRYAMQFLLDKQKMVDNLYSGFAQVTQTVPWTEHPSYNQIKKSVESLDISYDEEKALSLIKSGMEEAGAVLESGAWIYNQEPVNIIISYSNWDKSIEIASLLDEALKKAGFMTTLVYSDMEDDDAEPPESYTDAAELKWHISISGWIYYNQSQVLDAAILGSYVSDGWWEYENEDIKKLEEDLSNSKSDKERQNINSELAKKYLEDSTGVWLLAVDSISVARNDIKGLIQDPYVGIGNYTNIREAYIEGKDTLIIGLPSLYREGDSWNHFSVNGINMMYILNSVHDPFSWNKTLSLEEDGFRGSFVVNNKGEDKEISLPADTFFWDSINKKWQPVVDGDRKVITKISYDLSNYLGDSWHYGQEITWADIIFNVARNWDFSLDEEKWRSQGNNQRSEEFDPIIGLRISDQTLEVYLDAWYSGLQDFWVITRLLQRIAPWELYTATDDLVFEQNLYDYHFVDGSDREELNVFNSSHVDNIFKTLENFSFAKIQGMMTLGDDVYAIEDDLGPRVSSLKEWYIPYRHLYISDGPFYINGFNMEEESVDLRAFRDISYPFSKGDWR